MSSTLEACHHSGYRLFGRFGLSNPTCWPTYFFVYITAKVSTHDEMRTTKTLTKFANKKIEMLTCKFLLPKMLTCM